MFKFLKSLAGPTATTAVATDEAPAAAPMEISSLGAPSLNITSSLLPEASLPLLDWNKVQIWLDGLASDGARAQAWVACERAWLEHLRVALGPDYCLRQQGQALLLSTLDPKVADATLEFVNKTVQRIVRVLDGVAEVPEWGHDILIVFDDQESYYRYAAHYYPDAGEFAASSGMYINQGCGHFITVKADLRAVEPVIAHELTHACLSHLPIPAWLNEGLAVNTEFRLCPPLVPPADPRQMHARHRKFWGGSEIQEFWSGKSFLRSDQGNELSYDLAKILVGQFAGNWERFREFVLAANVLDGAAAAAQTSFGISLGQAVCAVLERDFDPAWEPKPQVWLGEPERGAF